MHYKNQAKTGKWMKRFANCLPSASASMEELDELVSGHIKELIKINTAEAELPERPPLGLPRCHISFNIRLKKTNETEVKLLQQRPIERSSSRNGDRDESRAHHGCKLAGAVLVDSSAKWNQGQGFERDLYVIFFIKIEQISRHVYGDP